MTNQSDVHDKTLRVAWWTLAVIVFGVTVAIRIRLLGIPLERDEGEYAYAGQLMLQGIPPYKLAYNMKFPGTYAVYAVIMSIFGQTILGIHLGLLLVNAATIALVFLLARRLINSTAGIAAATSYAVLSMSPSVLGLAAHATHFVMLPVLAGTLLLLLTESDRRAFRRLFASGLLFGIGLLMKQPAVFFILFGAVFLICNGVHRRSTLKTIALRSSIFGAGAIVPVGLTCLLLWQAGVFEKFWFWTINYAAQYGRLVPLSAAPRIFAIMVSGVIGSGWTLWMLAGLGLVTVWNKRARGSAVFLFGLLAASLLALSVGFYFREHYFIFILPVASLFAGVAISTLLDLAASRSIVRFLPLLLFCVALSQSILGDRKFYFDVSPIEASRISYGSNPFPESVRIAEYVRNHSSPGDTIAVLGSEPQIYFYAQRHSATGYIYTYGLMEPQKYAQQMQQEMIREIENARPKYLISVAMAYSWLRRPDSEQAIFTWANEYMTENYAPAALVNIKPTGTDYFFGDIPPPVEALKDYILIYRRNL